MTLPSNPDQPARDPRPQFTAEALAEALRTCLDATAWSRALVDLAPHLEAVRDQVAVMLRMIEEVERYPEDLQDNLVLHGWAGSHLSGAPDIVPPAWSSTPGDDTTGGER